jgi:hypothetical protein
MKHFVSVRYLMEIIQGAMEYEDMNIVLRTEGRKERDLSFYSMGDYPHVGCHLTSPTISHPLLIF